MVLAIPLLAWVAIYASIRMIAPGLSRLSGCAEIPLTIELDWGGFRLLAPGVDQYGTWAMVHGHVVQKHSWILLLSSVIHRSGLIVACNESTTILDGVDRFALQCRRTPNNQRVSNELIDEREPKGVALENPILQQTTRVFSRDLIDEQPEDWLWLRRYFMASALLRMDLVLLAGTALTSVVESPWMGLLVLIPLTLATLFKLRRGLRILFRKNAVISNLEFKVYEEGYEKRTNAYHTRVLWSVLRDANIERDRLYARYAGSEHPQPIFAKQWFLQESDWQVVCQLAQRRIGQSEANATSPEG